MYKIYKVMVGDTLEGIARKFNTTVSVLQDINDKAYINLGELIIVPNNTNSEWFDTYVIEKGDNLYSIAQKNDIALIDLLNINGLDKDNYIYPGQEIMVPKNEIGIIVTTENETLNSATKRLGISIEELLNQNANLYLLPDQLIIYKK